MVDSPKLLLLAANAIDAASPAVVDNPSHPYSLATPSPRHYLNSAFTTAFTDSFLRCVYFWPTPMNMMGWPVL